jgi:hypothetical protein
LRPSSISLVAILATLMSAPIMSAGRFSPLGPLGIAASLADCLGPGNLKSLGCERLLGLTLRIKRRERKFLTFNIQPAGKATDLHPCSLPAAG